VSFTKKVVTTYAKSLFENINNANLNSSKTGFEVAKITSKDLKNVISNVYIVGEELLLLSATLTSSKKMKSFFENPTYSEKQKLEILFNIFPGLTITTKSFLKVLTERSHLSLIPEISDEYTRLLLKFKNSIKVKLTTASSLDEKYGTLLLDKLKILNFRIYIN
jgi:F0F1-type ATP synthase delta subunit